MKKKILLTILIVISIFLLGIKTTYAASDSCNVYDSTTLCVYDAKNYGSYYKIGTCINNKKERNYIFYTTGAGSNKNSIQDSGTISSGNIQNGKLLLNSTGNVKIVYISKSNMDNIKSIAKNPPKYGEMSSSMCPKNIMIHSGNFCFDDEENCYKNYGLENESIRSRNLHTIALGESSLIKTNIGVAKKPKTESSKKIEKREVTDTSKVDNMPKFQKVNFCNQGTIDAFRILGHAIVVLKIVVPLLIVVFGMIDFSRAVISNDEKAIKVSTSALIRRAIAGIIIFFVPTICFTILNIIFEGDFTQKSDFISCTNCMLKVSSCDSLKKELPEK